MTSTFLKRAIIISLCGIAAIVVLYGIGLSNVCPIKHVQVVDELKKYQKTLDPELCEALVEKIIDLNNQCGIEIEVIDCG
ncbi:MAG TPA: hypothetical protein VLB45_05600 [Nitrosopumilaceae archaeon]|nr:hypothetical protein [Nitrosopumilaceae archaeon]